MQTLPPSVVEDAWGELDGADGGHVRRLVQQFRTEQPVLSGFLLAAEESVFAGDDRGEMLLYGVWAWLAFKRAGHTSAEITEETINAAFDENHRLFEALEHSTAPNVMDAAADWTHSYRQMPLLAALVSRIMSGNLEDPKRVDDFAGLIILHVKTLIDCLDS